MTEDVRVTYSVRDLLDRIDKQLELIVRKLDAKADLRDLVDLRDRVVNLERGQEKQDTINHERASRDATIFTRRGTIMGVVVVLLGVFAQIATLLRGGHW